MQIGNAGSNIVVEDEPRCCICQAPTRGDHCPRCGRPVCLEHIPSADELCQDCEVAYHEQRGAAGDRLAFWIPFGLVWLAFVVAIPRLLSMRVVGGGRWSFSTGIPIVDGLIGAALGSLLFSELGRRARNWIVRRRFLRR